MKIRNFLHKGLKRFYEDDSFKAIPAGTAGKLGKMLAFLEAMTDPDELRSLPMWRAHLLTGDRKSVWSLSVTRNWRLTFWIDADETAVCDVNLEDYH